MRFIGAVGSDASQRCRPRSFDLVEVRTGRRGDGHGICQVNRIVSRRGSVPLGKPPRRLFLFLLGTPPVGVCRKGAFATRFPRYRCAPPPAPRSQELETTITLVTAKESV